MKPIRPWAFALVLLVSQALLGCGSGISHTALNSQLVGDWNFAGNRSLRDYPILNATLLVNGTQVTAEGQVLVACTNAEGAAVGGSFDLSGSIAPDGTFTLTYPAGNLSSIQVKITGSVPAPGSATWNGTYTLTDLPGYTSCLVNSTAPFVATAYNPLDKTTYAGTLTSQYGSVDVSTTLTQGAVTELSLRSGHEIQYLPLTGVLSSSGTCTASGTSDGSINRIAGDLAALSFAASEESTISFIGQYGSLDEANFQQVLLAFRSGPCDGKIFSGTLTRQ